MSTNGFIHLRLHSAYSLSEGAIHLKQLTKLCEQHGMPAVAVTDTDNMFGALEQSVLLSEAGIQPIIGCIVHVVEDPAPQAGKDAEEGAPIVLLVQNDAGYRNLTKLVSKAYMDSDGTTRPQLPLAHVLERNKGLLLLTGGPEGLVGRHILHGNMDRARAVLSQIKQAFGDRAYVEIMRHKLDEEAQTEPGLLDLAYELDLPLVATNDVYFAERDMHEAHDALLCIADSTYVGQPERRHATPESYFKSADEMRMLFADLPEAIDNTLVIAKRCAFKVPLLEPILPSYVQGADEADELRKQAEAGLRERLKLAIAEGDDEQPYWHRLEVELDIIINMKFPGYFLIVSDFIKWAKNHQIPVGPGRGSGAGSVVAWALQITDLDPLRFGLLFERFLNPERVSMPDFDIDFCQDKRDQVIRYVQEKYGKDHVAQIITFGKLQARAVLRDVGRVLEMPYGQIDRLSKMVPNNPANPVTLAQAIEGEPRLQAERDGDEGVAHLLNTSLKLEGLYRHASTHAAGIVIGDRPLDELVPLYRDPRSEMPVTQFNMKWVEPAGLVKFDFLGLKTLTVIDRTAKLLKGRNIEVDTDHLPLDDVKTFEMLAHGDSAGVFQLEGSGMRDTLRQLKPDAFEDIIALVALYRPGPMDNIPTYIKRKHGEEQPEYLHEWLKPVLEETYGVIIYQEQVMQIAQILAGYSLGEADLLRRAMGKKKPEEMAAQRARFVDGAVEKGVDKGQASFIFDLVDKFAGYGFNKSHAAAYALVSYQTAWLKANHPVEFLAASMTLDMGNSDKLNLFRRELSRLDIPLLPPDVNASESAFTVERADDGTLGVRYALAAIKNVGAHAMDSMVEERQTNGTFRDLADFAQRVDPRQINKRQLENLVRAGALDGLNDNRAQTFAAIETLMRHAATAAEERESDQVGLFGDEAPAMAAAALRLPDLSDWSRLERLQQELDSIGAYLTEHPLEAYAKALTQQNVLPWSEALSRMQKSGATAALLAGVIVGVQERKSQKGRPFAFIEMSDPTGNYEVTFFSELLAGSRELLQVNTSVVVGVEARMDGDMPKMVAQSVRTIDDVVANASAGLRVTMDTDQPLPALRDMLAENGQGRGYVHVVLKIPAQRRQVELTLPDRYKVSPTLMDRLETVPGILELQEI